MLPRQSAWPQSPAASAPANFQTVDVYVDPHGKPLAAYQIELHTGAAEIVGVEGGQSPAFKAAPYYDPAALSHHRVIIAAFSLAKDLPSGKSRVARLHVYNASGQAVDYSATLTVAGTTDGSAIGASASISQGGLQ